MKSSLTQRTLRIAALTALLGVSGLGMASTAFAASQWSGVQTQSQIQDPSAPVDPYSDLVLRGN
jgi:hypothetical protein